jgi:NADH dehydrogenase/NADH:ubiquinone oxidoreductase subunit G
MRRLGSRRVEHGFVAIEWVAAVALLLLPIVVLVATVPSWAERRHAATVAAREAAKQVAAAWPTATVDTARVVAVDIAADHGVDPADVVVRVPSIGATRGSLVEVDVDVRMPAVGVGRMRVGSWRYTARALRRIDDYRSR